MIGQCEGHNNGFEIGVYLALTSSWNKCIIFNDDCPKSQYQFLSYFLDLDSVHCGWHAIHTFVKLMKSSLFQVVLSWKVQIFRWLLPYVACSIENCKSFLWSTSIFWTLADYLIQFIVINFICRQSHPGAICTKFCQNWTSKNQNEK